MAELDLAKEVINEWDIRGDIDHHTVFIGDAHLDRLGFLGDALEGHIYYSNFSLRTFLQKSTERRSTILHINKEELAVAPTLPEFWPQLQEALRDRVILAAYNASFDRARLAQSAACYGLQDLTQEWECAMDAYAAFCGNWSDYSCRYIWIPLAGTHRAVVPALAALERVREMAAVYEREYAEREQS